MTANWKRIEEELPPRDAHATTDGYGNQIHISLPCLVFDTAGISDDIGGRFKVMVGRWYFLERKWYTVTTNNCGCNPAEINGTHWDHIPHGPI